MNLLLVPLDGTPLTNSLELRMVVHLPAGCLNESVCEIRYGKDGWTKETSICIDCCVFFDFLKLYYDYCNRI